MVELLDDDAETLLDGAITDVASSLVIIPVAGSPVTTPFRIWIGDEICIVTNITGGDTYALIRGVENSIAAAHADGDAIFYPLSSGVAVQLAVDIARLFAGAGGGGGGGSSATRATLPFTTASLANGAIESGSFTLKKSSLIFKVVASALCRIRLYGASTGRTADVARAVEVTADWNVNLLLELLLDDSGLLTFNLQPPAICENQESPVVDTIYYNVTNLSGITAAITVTTTVLGLES